MRKKNNMNFIVKITIILVITKTMQIWNLHPFPNFVAMFGMSVTFDLEGHLNKKLLPGLWTEADKTTPLWKKTKNLLPNGYWSAHAGMNVLERITHYYHKWPFFPIDFNFETSVRYDMQKRYKNRARLREAFRSVYTNFAAILGPIFFFWSMWTSGWVTSVQVRMKYLWKNELF